MTLTAMSMASGMLKVSICGTRAMFLEALAKSIDLMTVINYSNYDKVIG